MQPLHFHERPGKLRIFTCRWVRGDDFFDREAELQVLKYCICRCNPVLLAGQRRLGETGVTRELGRQLETKGWALLFSDVEDTIWAEDVIAAIAEAAYPIRPISSQLVTSM